jgi:hypothetical protein
MDAAVQPVATRDPVFGENFRVERQLRDALRLCEFAVTSGLKMSDGMPIPTEIISHIETTSAKLGFLKEPSRFQEIGKLPDSANGYVVKDSISAAEWVEFQLAYYKLATLTSPVTAQTLCDTEPFAGYSDSPSLWESLKQKTLGSSPANRFTRGIWLVAICFVSFVVCADWYSWDAAKNSQNATARFIQIMTLYAYGGLGACAYLLRSAHSFIYKRTFDVRREPEYFNRILLGTIAGGTITLFVKQASLGDSGTIQLSSAALGFIAGYSTDFLFSKIEGFINVLLPKDQSEPRHSAAKLQASARKSGPEGNISLEDLTDRRDKVRINGKNVDRSVTGHLAASNATTITVRGRSKDQNGKPGGSRS